MAATWVGASWVEGVVFAAIVLIVVLVSYAVLFFVFRKHAPPEGD